MKQAPGKTLTAPIRRSRFVWVAFFLCVWVTVIAVRLVLLQVVDHKEYVERASKQQERTFPVAAQRGLLYDRNLRELAMTVKVDSIFAVPSDMSPEGKVNAAHLLAQIVHTDPEDGFTTEQQILSRLNNQRNYAWIARRVTAETAERVRELNLKGIDFVKEFKRFYPDNGLAAQVLGYVGVDDEGLGGLELKYNDELEGQPGRMLTAIDAKRHVRGSTEREPQPGDNLVLSLDANIQYIAQRALDAQVEKMKAAHGTVVVQDPHTGQILALAISPGFNPNDSRHLKPGSLTDLAVSDVYEPGSTFKLVTYAAALDAAGVQPTDMVDCQGGSMTMDGRTLHDDHTDHFGVVTVQYALEHSSDVGAAKMALKLGDQKFYDYIKAFGFGDRTGIELPSETRGLLRPPRRWDKTSILSLAIGQEVGVTPIQLVTMVSAIANGGVYMPPHILLQDTDEMKGDPRLKPVGFHPANELPIQLPDGAHRVIKELTAAKMRSMMQGIVVEGTGKNAQLNGYSAGGKTGTAQKVDVETHTYSHTKLVASFAGFAPVSSPAISIAVVIDTPTVGTRYGSETSAPVFREVAQQTLEYLGVPYDQPLKTPKELLAQRKSSAALDDDDPSLKSDSGADLNAMFAQVNDLPADDPLRSEAGGATVLTEDKDDGKTDVAAAPAVTRPAAPAVAAPARATASAKSPPAGGMRQAMLAMLPERVVQALRGGGEESAASQPAAPRIEPVVQARANGSVVVDAAARVAVPSFSGSALRSVVERAAAAGLRVDPVGDGLAREQAPAAGTMVPAGTEIVVRFGR